MIQKPKDFIRERIIGDYTITLPEPPAVKDIANYNLPQADQKFIRTEIPKDFKSWPREERRKFITKEWDRRLNGYWFYNNGNIEYITGINYFYITYWKLNTGFPMFIDCDRDFFYVWDLVANDTRADGLAYITFRGEGKTSRATCIAYESTSRRENVNAGIQSKNEPDAKKIFKKIIYSWSKLPSFFRPIDIGVSRPARILEFAAPSIKNTKEQEKEDSVVLNSQIDYEDSGIAAYDGQNLFFVFVDEFGKTVDVDVDERMKTLRECLRAGRGKHGRGKILATTTVEEMVKRGGRNAKKVWDKADSKVRDGNGATKNGLYRLFKPADYGYLEIMNGESFVDDYGYSLREKAYQYFMNRRKPLKGADLNSEKRKFPLKEADIWISDSKKSVYDTDKIDEQLLHNETLPVGTLVRGDFKWTDGIPDKMPVIWHPNEKGKWLVYWMPTPELRNKQIQKNGQKTPGYTDGGAFGLDPYDNKETSDGRKSDAASYGFRKFDPMVPYDSGIFVSEYVGRPEMPEIMWEDMILESVFYGWEILIESNKIGTINHFRKRGYFKYLMMRPEETQTASSRKMEEPGIPMSGDEARLALVYATESYIIQKVGVIHEEGVAPYMGRCYFDKLLHNWKDFDLDKKWTEFDSMVGGGLAILGARKYIPKKKNSEPIKLFQLFNTSGMQSIPLD